MQPGLPAAMDIRLWSRFTQGIMAVLVASGLLVGGLLTWASIWSEKKEVERSLSLRGKALVRALGRAAFVPLVLEDAGALDPLVEGFMGEPDVVYAAIYTAQGESLSSRPRGADLPPAPAGQPVSPGVSERRVSGPGRPTIQDLILPLRYGSAPTDPSDGKELLGYARIGLTHERIDRQIRVAVRNNVALCLALMSAAFLTGASLIRRMTRRMRGLMEQAQMSAALQRANKELEAFSYSVSHDLRAPLRSIDGFSHALLEDCSAQLDEPGKDHLRRIRAACTRMGQLIDDLLALSRVIRQDMRWDTVDLAALARSAAGQLERAEPGRRVGFVAPETAKARGDAGLLRIVLENLLGNAWKFTGRRPDPRVEFGETEKDGRRAFFVRDNGAGFDMAYAGKLFGPFQRLHDDSEFPGTGIGLATVRRIVERHGGRVWAESAVDRGAVFYFTLPRKEPARSA
ncbi:MAG: ATP-binding protein [Elusimicrobiota bacterium]